MVGENSSLDSSWVSHRLCPRSEALVRAQRIYRLMPLGRLATDAADVGDVEWQSVEAVDDPVREWSEVP